LQTTGSEPIFCYVTDGSGVPAQQRVAAVSERVRAAVVAGANWVQIREKDLGTRELARLVSEVVRAAQTLQHVRVIVNDRADVALAAGAGGVHLGGRSIPAAELTGWLDGQVSATGADADLVTGVSCHSVADARAAESGRASYVIFGPVYRTPSKLGFGAPHGVERLAEVCAAVKIPVLAIGGVDAENARDCFGAGAAGVAAIRMFQEVDDVAEMQARLEQARGVWRARS
jgi:thiamine-phosphate pyrophosphorylase